MSPPAPEPPPPDDAGPAAVRPSRDVEAEILEAVVDPTCNASFREIASRVGQAHDRLVRYVEGMAQVGLLTYEPRPQGRRVPRITELGRDVLQAYRRVDALARRPGVRERLDTRRRRGA